jgi:hypothetical protein
MNSIYRQRSIIPTVATDESSTMDYKYVRDIILSIVVASKDMSARLVPLHGVQAPRRYGRGEDLPRGHGGHRRRVHGGVHSESLTEEALNKMQYVLACHALRGADVVPFSSSSSSEPVRQF